jgi:hypothetical protein
MWNERDAVRRRCWREEDPEVPDRSAVRNVLDLDAKTAAAEEAARAEERSSAEERSAAAAAADVVAAGAHAHVREHAHVHCSPVDSYSEIQGRAAEGFAGAGDRGGEAQGTTREFAGAIWTERWMRT